MASYLTQRPLISQDENFDIHRKRAVMKGKSTGSKMELKKSGAGFGNRKALGDITNKSSLHNETSLKKKNTPKVEVNVAEEMFLHDHKKCIESQKAAMRPPFWETVLPGYVFTSPLKIPDMKSTESDLDMDGQCFPPEPVEIPMFEFSDLFTSSSLSSPPSPIHLDSPPTSPFDLEYGPVEFMLKEDEQS